MANPPPGHPHYMSEESRYASAPPEPEEKEMSTSPAAAKYQELRNQIAAARKTMEQTAKGLFTEMSAELFNDNPTLMAFGWQQYTPYFNDGEECVFRCNGDYPSLAIKVGDDIIMHDENHGSLEINGEEVQSTYDLTSQFERMGVDSFSKGGKQYVYDKKTKSVTVDGKKIPTYDDYSKQFDKLSKAVSTFMGVFEDEDMELMFGDHVQITVNRDGTIETEEYEHD